MASYKTYVINGPNGTVVDVAIRYDGRLKKTARWERAQNGTINLRVPQKTSNKNIEAILSDIEQQLVRQQKITKRRTDNDLQARAESINQQYFNGNIRWEAIRWVGNMSKRLGSCTTGGPTDGHIRISDKIKDWPAWVVDYVIAHELAHRVHPNHSKDFWNFLENAYPLTERARGFIIGVGFSSGTTYQEDND